VAPTVIGRVVEGGPVAQAGLKTGDRITAIDGRPVQYWEDVQRAVQDSHGGMLGLTVQGAAGERKVGVTPVQTKTRDLFGDERQTWDLGARPYVPPSIGELVAVFPAQKAGLKRGDVIASLEGKPVLSWDELAEGIQQRPGQPTRLEVKRGAETLAVSVIPNAVKERGPDSKEIEVGRIGISPAAGFSFVRSNPIQAVREGVDRTVEVTVLTAVGLYKIVVGQLDRKNIGGPIQIAVTAGEQARQGVASLAFFTAVISVNLFLLNLLPVPMLDGGHLLFFLFEAVLGRPLSLRKREVAQQVGFGLLMLLMVYAVYNDLDRIGLFSFFR